MPSLWDAFRGRIAEAIAPKPIELIPAMTFENVTGFGPGGYVNPFVNPQFYASEETAIWVAKHFEADEVRLFVSPGSEPGSHFAVSKPQRFLYWSNGKGLLYINGKPATGYVFNAGHLAAYFARNPRSQSYAESEARKAIEVDRKHRKTEPLWLVAYVAPPTVG